MIIREMTIDDAEGKGYVHYEAWNETYTGLISQEYLDQRSSERCINSARMHPEHTFVAEADGKIIAFACYMKYRGDDLRNAGEVNAIYVLRAYQKQGIGKALLDACFERLSEYNAVVVWALKQNRNAIDFYTHYGFAADGTAKKAVLSEHTEIEEIRMIKKNPFYKSH